jgi:eukaryotic-like serine/threonine-protein kinase
MDIEQFIALMKASGLSSMHEARQLAAGFLVDCNTQGTPETVERFCDYLIAANLFTDWQCTKLRAGKWKGFYMDNYLLLEWISKDDKFCYYKARDTRDGKLVTLTVTPMPRATGPDIEYTAGPYSEST